MWGKLAEKIKKYRFDNKIYRARVFNACANGDKNKNLVYGPNIADWPKMEELKVSTSAIDKAMFSFSTTESIFVFCTPMSFIGRFP